MAAQTIRLSGPVVLDFGNGIRIRLEPESMRGRGSARAAGPPGRRGRKPGPATQALIEAMEADAAGRGPRGRDDYLRVLREAGHKGSEAGAAQIVAREAKRVFGRTLGRGRAAGPKGTGTRGRQPRLETVLLRERIAKDKADGGVRDAKHYLTWLMDQKGVKMGLKGARPLVYRELRAAK